MPKPQPPVNDREAVRTLLEAVLAAKWEVHRVVYDDGEDAGEPMATVDEIMEVVFSVDISYVHVKRYWTEHGWMMFVLGNDPEEVLCDYTVNLEPDVGPLQKKWMGI